MGINSDKMNISIDTNKYTMDITINVNIVNMTTLYFHNSKINMSILDITIEMTNILSFATILNKSNPNHMLNFIPILISYSILSFSLILNPHN